MDATSGIIGAMFMISNSLLYPVIIILLGLVAWSLISIGQLVSEYASRNRDIAKLKVGCRAAKEIYADAGLQKSSRSPEVQWL